MVILFVIVSCYLLRVVPNVAKPFLTAAWGFCCAGFLLMINEVIIINSVTAVRMMTTIAVGGCGTLLYAAWESWRYNKRRSKVLHRWKNEITLDNAA